MCEGLTNKAVAAQLFLSPRTVETHLAHVFRKLDVRTRTELAHVLGERAAPRGYGVVVDSVNVSVRL